MNNTINHSKMLKILSEDAIAQSVDHLEDLESEGVNLPSTQQTNLASLEDDMGRFTNQVKDYIDSDERGLGKSIAKGVGKGVVKHHAKKATAKGIIAAMKKFGIKNIPLLGSVKAALDILVSGGLFIKNLTEFTELLIEKTGVEIEGFSSLLGQYSFTELSGSELKKIADALESGNVSQEDMKILWEEYKEPQRDFKELLINICLALKELSLGLGLGGAIALSVIPVEAGIRELLKFVSKEIYEFTSSHDGNIAIKAINMYFDTIAVFSYFSPLFGWLWDNERRYQWARIDDALSRQANSSSRNLALDIAGDVAYGATDAGYTIARAADETIDAFSRGLAASTSTISENKNNKKCVDLNRWQKLSGIS